MKRIKDNRTDFSDVIWLTGQKPRKTDDGKFEKKHYAFKQGECWYRSFLLIPIKQQQENGQ